MHPEVKAEDIFAAEANGHPEPPVQADSGDYRDRVIQEQAAQIEQMNHFIQLQANTIGAFQTRTWKLEMEIVELMSQLPQAEPAQPVFSPEEVTNDDTG